MPSADRHGVYAKIAAYYAASLQKHGPTPRGVDWNSQDAQNIRFDQITKILPDSPEYTLLDYGCGYGALIDYLEASRPPRRYVGYDLSPEMIERARDLHGRRAFCSLTNDRSTLQTMEYTVSSGIFSVRMDVPVADWESYILDTLDNMRDLSLRAFSFNMLTAYSDSDRMRSDLYYADPLRFFSYCRDRFSRNVALLHDYDLYEFTILVRLGA